MYLLLFLIFLQYFVYTHAHVHGAHDVYKHATLGHLAENTAFGFAECSLGL